MLTINVDAKVAYHHVDVLSAVKVVNFMNGLVACINKDTAIKKIEKLPTEERSNYSTWNEPHTIYADEAEILYEEFTKLGFCSTVNLIDEEKIDIEQYRKR